MWDRGDFISLWNVVAPLDITHGLQDVQGGHLGVAGGGIGIP